MTLLQEGLANSREPPTTTWSMRLAVISQGIGDLGKEVYLPPGDGGLLEGAPWLRESLSFS